MRRLLEFAEGDDYWVFRFKNKDDFETALDLAADADIHATGNKYQFTVRFSKKRTYDKKGYYERLLDKKGLEFDEEEVLEPEKEFDEASGIRATKR